MSVKAYIGIVIAAIIWIGLSLILGGLRTAITMLAYFTGIAMGAVMERQAKR